MLTVGERKAFTASFEDDQGNLVDPTRPVVLAVERPDGSTFTTKMQREATGKYKHRQTFDQVGFWDWRVETGDDFKKRGESFYVLEESTG